VQGQVELLRLTLEGDYWGELWASLAMPVLNFADLSLAANTSDVVIWRLCQQRQLLLITANRNKEGLDSLEATIQNENTPSSLPVFTLADSEHIRHSKSYRERVADKLMEYLVDLEHYRGAGRLYLP